MLNILGLLTKAPDNSFTPVSRTYTTGTAATETVPTGATQVVITVRGGAGAGGRDSTDTLWSGGGGGSLSKKTIAVTGGDTLTYTVAPQTSTTQGEDGTSSTCTGTVAGGAVSMTAGGGQGGQNLSNGKTGAGGTASGGDTNTSGSTGLSYGGGGAGAAPGGGAGGAIASDGAAPGGGGGGRGSAGAIGRGARGEITFEYT